MKQESRFDQRHVEGLAVVGHQGAMRGGPRRQFREHGAFVLEARHQELPDADGVAIDRRTANEEGLRAGTGEESCGFKVQEKEGRDFSPGRA